SADNDEPERDGEVGEGDRGVRKRVEPNQSRLPEKTESVRLQPGVAKEPLAQCGQHRNSPIDPYSDLVSALVTPQHLDRLVKHIRMRLREKTHVVYFAIPRPTHQAATDSCSKYVVAQIVCANGTRLIPLTQVCLYVAAGSRRRSDFFAGSRARRCPDSSPARGWRRGRAWFRTRRAGKICDCSETRIHRGRYRRACDAGRDTCRAPSASSTRTHGGSTGERCSPPSCRRRADRAGNRRQGRDKTRVHR